MLGLQGFDCASTLSCELEEIFVELMRVGLDFSELSFSLLHVCLVDQAVIARGLNFAECTRVGKPRTPDTKRDCCTTTRNSKKG